MAAIADSAYVVVAMVLTYCTCAIGWFDGQTDKLKFCKVTIYIGPAGCAMHAQLVKMHNVRTCV